MQTLSLAYTWMRYIWPIKHTSCLTWLAEKLSKVYQAHKLVISKGKNLGKNLKFKPVSEL
jgi:hypothetical protein